MRKAKTTLLGYCNRNRQVVVDNQTGRPGSDHLQYIYVLQCGDCGFCYGSNGTDNWQRKCPNCQAGKPCSDPSCVAVKAGGDGNCQSCRNAKDAAPVLNSNARQSVVSVEKTLPSSGGEAARPILKLKPRQLNALTGRTFPPRKSGGALSGLTSDSDLVMRFAAQCENFLKRRFNAKGKGLREKVTSVRKKLPSGLAHQLLRVADIRNKAFAHSDAPAFQSSRQKESFSVLFEVINKQLGDWK